MWRDSLREVLACAYLTLAIPPHLETRGVYDILYTSVNGHDCPSRTDAVAADPGVDDPWLFTDPAAWLLYAHQGRLEQLKQDILAYVMYEEQWAPDELQLKRETQRLLSANVVLPKGTFSYLSPHPTVYRADGEGVIEIAGQKFHFDSGQDIVFVPWLARVSWPSLTGPVRIARLQSTVNLCLCCDAFPRVNGLCERALAILRQTLPNGAIRQIARY